MSTDRRRIIVQRLEADGRVRVDELATHFDVSEVTIRKDLAELESRGVVQRTHGGAVFAQKSVFNPSFLEKVQLQSDAKQRIAECAAGQVEEGDALVLDAGTSTLALANLLKSRFEKLTVITSSIPIAMALSETQFELILLGGQIRQHSLAIVGPQAVSMLKAYHAEKAFLGATGVTVQGYSTPNAIDAELKQAMMAAVDRAYVLCDASKIGHAALARYSVLESVHLLITDSAAPRAFLAELEARKAAYVLAL
jgi:DeoR family transcriptional regulator of aga operon/DeoR family fructose operon transcriptional repressor